jgi:hypothetical protein
MNTDKKNKNKHFQAKTEILPKVLLSSYRLPVLIVLSVFVSVDLRLNMVFPDFFSILLQRSR